MLWIIYGMIVIKIADINAKKIAIENLLRQSPSRERRFYSKWRGAPRLKAQNLAILSQTLETQVDT